MPDANILVVGGQATAARELAANLRKGGYNVAGIAFSGEEALEQISQSLPDLVLLDIRLRGELDGIETAKRVHREFDLPVVFLTSHADAVDISEAETAEPFGYLTKPFKIADLLNTIPIALHKHDVEQKLKERDNWLTLALSSAGDGVIVTDSSGHIRFFNYQAAQILDVPEANVTGRHLSEVAKLTNRITGLPAGDLPKQAILQGATMDAGKDLVVRSSSGELREVEGEIALCRVDDEVIGTVFTFRDVTLRNRREEQLRQELRSKAVAQLAGVISNQVSTLLKVTVRHSDEALRDIEADHRIRGSLEAIKLGVDDMSKVAGQLSTLSSSPVSFPTVLDLNELISDACFALRQELSSKIDLVTDLSPSLSAVRADPADIKQAIAGLVLYAGAGMPDGGAVTIQTRDYSHASYGPGGETNRYVYLAVNYTGPAISQEETQTLFDPFSEFEGLGGMDLSLFLVRGTIDNARGSITVTSSAEQGTTFEILLPQAASTNLAASTELYAPVGSPTATILLVETDASVRNMLGNILEGAGYDVLAAHNSGEALQWLASYEAPIDMLITNLVMPEMQGTDLARQFLRRYSTLKTVFLSDQPVDSALTDTWSKLGAYFFQKPFGQEQFGHVVRDMIQSTASAAPVGIGLGRNLTEGPF